MRIVIAVIMLLCSVSAFADDYVVTDTGDSTVIADIDDGAKYTATQMGSTTFYRGDINGSVAKIGSMTIVNLDGPGFRSNSDND